MGRLECVSILKCGRGGHPGGYPSANTTVGLTRHTMDDRGFQMDVSLAAWNNGLPFGTLRWLAEVRSQGGSLHLRGPTLRVSSFLFVGFLHRKAGWCVRFSFPRTEWSAL